MEQLVIELSKKLIARDFKIATVESCTGGGLAFELTSLSGSSAWFDRGFVTYSNLSKHEMVGVNLNLIDKHGAVSEETARAMAEGALRHSAAQVSVAITGVAGPTGGSPGKPVGTVYFAWAGINIETQVTRVLLAGDRTEIRRNSIRIALEGLLEML